MSIKNIVLMIHSWRPALRAALQASATFALIIASALAETGIQGVTSEDQQQRLEGWLWVLGILLGAMVLFVPSFWYRKVIEDSRIEDKRRDRIFADARERLSAIDQELLSACEGLTQLNEIAHADLRRSLICDHERLQYITRAFWEIVNSHHNEGAMTTDRIEFEVTLITKSHRGEFLTIAAWRNRENRRPPSLNLQEKGEAEIYGKTEAAKMMNGAVTETRIIPDTANPGANYEQLYEGQKVRIRSTVLHPVLSQTSKPLGVLVLHCDRPDFFRIEEKRYWKELCKIFSAPLALELGRISTYNHAAGILGSPLEPYRPF